jgi:dolichyl-phosphate-mannose-protein mannosyltransferase
MIATGASLAATLGSKMVGLFTFLTIGTAVLVDLWDILDVRKGHSMVRIFILTVKVISPD